MNLPINCVAQKKLTKRIVSYNVENLFDTEDDPESEDEDFLPQGAMRWDRKKYSDKLSRIARVFSEISGWDSPVLMAMCEVENERVVNDLLQVPALKVGGEYRYVVSNGKDLRGIDVALIWDSQYFRHVETREIPAYGPRKGEVSYPHSKNAVFRSQGTGRNSLWTTLKAVNSGELLDVFVVHLPSRRGGTRSTDNKRLMVAERIYRAIEGLQKKRPNANIIILGDFNDNPSDTSITKGLRAISVEFAGREPKPNALYNLASPLEKARRGTHVHEGKYWTPDQIIVSGTLLRKDSPIQIKQQSIQIYLPPYMEDTSKNHPKRTKRSFKGNRYNYGYSDHVPIFVDIVF